MVNRSILEKFGCTPQAWRTLLEDVPAGTGMLGHEKEMLKAPDMKTPGAKKALTQEERRARLIRRVRSRVEAGRQYNLTNYRTAQAIEQIWNTPYKQVSPTLLRDTLLQMQNKPTAEIESALRAIGVDVNGMWVDGPLDEKTRQPTKLLNPPVFTAVMVPLVSAYLSIRWAKLFNDRNLMPFHKFESTINSALDRARCEVLTARAQTWVAQFGVPNYFKQGVLNMLLFSQQMQFTLEGWWYEQQIKFADKEDVARSKRKTEIPEVEQTGGSGAETLATGESGEPQETPETKKVEVWDGRGTLKEKDLMVYTVKEGLRYHQPHVTRSYWDLAHPQWTLNTGTGCEFAGHWRVLRWKELRDNPDFYNTHRVSWGHSPWWNSNLGFFQSVYNQCVMDWPTIPQPPENTDSKDRESWIASNSFYNESHGEQAVVVTEHREIVVPKEDGLGDYPYPIWARFVVAGDGTIVYAEPMPYQPVTVYRDNGDDRKSQDASLALKITPFQDQVSNLLSQYIYAARQNLANITLVDENVVEKGMINTIKNLGEWMIRGVNIFGFDSKKVGKMLGMDGVRKAIESHRFPTLDTNAILMSIRTVIDLTERVLQFSSQEVAQAATHEQTKAEMDLIRDSTTNILRFTGDPVDQALSAQARQFYEALMAYGDDDFYAVIPYNEKLDQKELEELGITYVTKPGRGDKKVMVRSKRSALLFWSFMHAPAPEQRKDNIEVARMISEMVRDWFMSNPVGLSALGPDQLVDMANMIAKMAGLPFDRPIINASLTTEEQNRAAQEQLKAMVDQVLTDMKKGMMPLMEQVQQNTSAIQQIQGAIGVQPQPNDPALQAGGVPPGQVNAPPSMAGAV